MATGRRFVCCTIAAVFLLLYGYGNARPTMDSIYDDYVYSGAIFPISGAVPKKISRHHRNGQQQNNQQQNSKSETTTADPRSGTSRADLRSGIFLADPRSGTSRDDSRSGTSMAESRSGTSRTDSRSGTSMADLRSGISMADSRGGTSMAESRSGTSRTDPSNDTSMAAKEMISQSNSKPTMDSFYGDHVNSGSIYYSQNSHQQNSNSNSNTAAEEIKTQKAKKIFDMLGIDLSQIDISQMDLTHKFDGKDSLQPSLCHDTYNDRYGVGKHLIRGARDVGFAIVSGAEGLIDGLLADLPLVPNITSGIGGGLKAVICAIEDGFSDIGSDLDSVLDIAKNGLVDFFELKGPHPVLDIPEGIGGIAIETVKAGEQLIGDAASGVRNAVGELLGAL